MGKTCDELLYGVAQAAKDPTRPSAERSPVELVPSRMTLQPKIAIVSLGVPPSPYGQSRVLGQLLEGVPSLNCLLLSERPPKLEPERDKSYGIYRKLRRPKYSIWNPAQIRWLLHVNQYSAFIFSVLRRAREIAREIRAFQADVIVACTASPFDIPASTLAALRTGTPLVVYLFDDPIFQWEAGSVRRFAQLWEPFWSRLAKAAIVPNEYMARIFHERTGMQPISVRNPVSDAAFKVDLMSRSRDFNEPISIVYTGTVYHAQADAFRNLVQALECLKGRFLLDIYTSQSEGEVAGHGVFGPHIRLHAHLEQESSYAAQRKADILFLPLAFRSPIQEVLRSSAPAKMGEYLASGRPLLVHAPADTFVVEHIRANRAGVIVDAPDPAQLSAALDRIVTGREDVASQVQNALVLAQLYRASAAQQSFWNLLGLIAAD
jgi:glycosyltransferase involved in cell wall biosynthesis